MKNQLLLKIKFYFIFLLIAVLLSIYGCETNPPNSNFDFKEYGFIYVTSNIDSAEIYVDGISSGKFTPDTIQVEIGNRLISLIKDSFIEKSSSVIVQKNQTSNIELNLLPVSKRIVLLEDFANVSCIPCVTSNAIIEQLTSKSYGSGKIVAVKYATNFPAPNDIFYTANPEDSDSRINFYNVLFAPTLIIDGIEKPISSDSISIKEKIDSRLNKIPNFNILLTSQLAGSKYSIKIYIELLNAENITFSDLVLHTVIVESEIKFDTPPGSNGETIFYQVMRKMLPSNQGEMLSGLSAAGDKTIINREIDINSAWNSNEINAVVFIQNKITKEVLQASSTLN